MAITVGIATVAVGAYGAYNSKKQGDRANALAQSQNSRQGFFANELMDLMKNPSKILEDPGYKASFDQGTEAVNRSNALKGFTGSGNAAIELQSFGQNFSSKYLRDQEALLASLSGAGFNPASALQVGQQSNNDSFSQFGSVLASLGYSFGGQAGAGANPAGGMSSSGMSNYSEVPGGGGFHTTGGYIVNLPGD